MKAISSVVAAVLITTISVALVGTTYFFSQGLLKGATAETFEVIDVFSNLIIVRNLGTQPIQNFTVLIDGKEIDAQIKEAPLESGKIGTVELNTTGIQAGRHELVIMSKSMSQRWTWEFQYISTTTSTTMVPETTIPTTTFSETTTTIGGSSGKFKELQYETGGLEDYINTSDAEQSTGTAWKEALSLTWNDPSNSKWLVLASWESRHSATAANGNYQVSKDGVEQALYVERVLQANNEYISYFFPQVHQGDSGTVKYNISFQTASGTAYVRRVRLVAIRLDNLQNADYNYSFDATQVNNLDASWSGPEDENVTISPSIDGLYLILASLAKRSGNTGRSVWARVAVDSEFIPSSTGNFGTIQDTATTEFHPFQVIALRKLTVGPHTISLQARSSSQTSAAIRDRSVVVIRLSNIFTFFNVSDTGETSTASTAFQNKSTLTIPTGNNGNYLIFSMLTLRGGTSGAGYYYESRTFSDDYGEIGKFQDFRPQATTDYITSGMVNYATFDANQHTIKNQFRTAGAAATTYAKNSEIIAIKLNSSVATSNGWLNPTLDNPIPSIYNSSYPLGVSQYDTFVVNSTIECRDASCGKVSGSVRYNDSLGEPNVVISTSQGSTPFNIVGDIVQSRDDDYVYRNWGFNVSNQIFPGNPGDIAYNGTHFWVVNRSTSNTGAKIFRYNKTGYYDDWNITVPSGQTLLEGLDVNGTHIGITNNGGTKNVTFFDINTGNYITSFSVSTQLGTAVPSDLVFNATHVWVLASSTTNRYVYRYRSDGTYDNWNFSYNTVPGHTVIPDGLEFNGTHFFIVDSTGTGGHVWGYDSTGNYVYWNFSTVEETPWGLTWDKNENNFYTVDFYDYYVRRYEKNSGNTASNPISCGILNQGNVCYLNWTINVTGSTGDYKIDVNYSSDNYPSVGNNDTLNSYIRISGGNLPFQIKLPGQSWISSSVTKPGTITTPIEFNATASTDYKVQPCIVGYGCVIGYKQNSSTAIFIFNNTGTIAEQWNISLSQSLSSYGITLYGNTSINQSLQQITTNGWIASNNIPVGDTVQAWLWADFVDSPAGTVPNIYINHTSLQAL